MAMNKGAAKAEEMMLPPDMRVTMSITMGSCSTNA